MMDRINLTIPEKTLRKLNRMVLPFKRSQAITYAIEAMLSADKREIDGYRSAFSALVKDE